MAIQLRPTHEQIGALAERTKERETGDLSGVKCQFVSEFLELGDRVVNARNGMGQSIGKGFMLWEKSGHSKMVAVPTEEDSLPMGVTMRVYKTSMHRYRFTGDKAVSSLVTSAEVYAGMIDERDPFRGIVAGKLVLQVFNHPPTVYFGLDGNLTMVEPDTQEWTEMTELATVLTSQEQDLISN